MACGLLLAFAVPKFRHEKVSISKTLVRSDLAMKHVQEENFLALVGHQKM
jgi:hypothetical protein